MHTHFMKSVLAVLAAIAFGGAAFAGPQYLNRDGYAVSGYDAVAYHTVGEATPGDEAFSTEYNGSTWLFASQENLDLFVAEPATYAPAYDGHCAYAAYNGQKVRTDPEAWAVVDGVLYLNFNQGIQRRWSKDTDEYIAGADEEWATLEAEPAAKPGRK